MMKMPEKVIGFHLWYFREKGWIQRAENGGFVITAEGVDKVEQGEIEFNQHLRLESKSDSTITLEHASASEILAS